MPDTEDDKPLETPTNAQPENPPEAILSTEDTETNNPNRQTANMEVHHHAHHEGKKNWKSYIWEFLMLFLAVFCGFLAEYQLEHKIERDREKEFIETMISDLREDTTLLSSSIYNFRQKGIELDSLIVLLNSKSINDNRAELYYYGRKANRFQGDFFTSTDRTIQQMKNSGAFRLIRNAKAASSILQYYSELNGLYLLQNNTNDQSVEYRSITYTLFDPVVFETMVNDETENVIIKPMGNPSLVSYDKTTVARISMILHYMKGSRMVLSARYSELRGKAAQLIELLKKEYHVE